MKKEILTESNEFKNQHAPEPEPELEPESEPEPELEPESEPESKFEQEILTDPNEIRYALGDIKYDEIWSMYKKSLSTFWIVDEIDFSKDREHYEKCSDNIKHFIIHVLAFFAASDTIVNINLEENFIGEITIPEAKFFYTYQAANENIHSETYSLMINTLIRDKKEKKNIFNAVENYDCIKEKKNWAEKWIWADKNIKTPPIQLLAQRLIAFAIVEGVFFSGSFCAIYWIKHNFTENFMPGLTSSNEFIARDEGLHTEFACLLYKKYISNKLPKEKVYEMFEEAIKLEKNFIIDALPCKLIGMNSEHMIKYIKFVADRLLVSLGYPKKYDIKECPFPFMESISLQGKSNFFEERETSYQKYSSNNNLEDDNIESFEMDF